MCDFCSLSVLLCVAALSQTNSSSSSSSTSNISTSITAVVIYCGRFSKLPQTFRSYRFHTKLTYKLSQVSLPAPSSSSFFGPRDKTSQTDRYSGVNHKRSRTKKNSQCTYKSSQKQKSQKVSEYFSLLLPWLSTLRRHDENPVGRESAKCSQISHHRDQNKHKQGPTDRRWYRGEHHQKRERELQRQRESLQVALPKHSKRRAALFCEGRDGGKGGRGGQEGEGDIYSQKDIY